ncbi:MAG: sensor diguanylate cyclase [Myxococcales bacterium]|nr:sensor diguanylate cyclase [Myxococcales bacterium]
MPLPEEHSILTLAPEEISRFLMRTRRDRDLERFEVRLDEHLREVLARADDFVPSQAGAILLDDPRAKLQGKDVGRLTVIACFGEGFQLGTRVPADQGGVGTIYQRGQPLKLDDIIGVPVILGESICGVLELRGRRHDPHVHDVAERLRYEARDLELLRIFAAYISSSIQNALDAIRSRELARRDDLTGLYNDRFLYRRMTEDIARAERDGTNVSLLFLDLDEFKVVNDTWGHLAGSRTLREVGQLIGTAIPPGAVAARYGGDEFVIILPGADAATASVVGEALRKAIGATAFLTEAGEIGPGPAGLHVSASLGVAAYHEHVGPFGSLDRRQNALLRLADTAMYQSKSDGKNRLTMAEAED